MQVVREHHRDREPPLVSVQDEAATSELFQSAFCRAGWRLFDPATVSWRFHGDRYIERLRHVGPSPESARPIPGSARASPVEGDPADRRKAFSV